MSLVRKISPLDCSYLAADTESSSPMVNQYVVEGIGSFSQIELKAAIEEAAEFNPGICVRLKGRWFWRYWDAEGLCPQVKIQSAKWLGDTNKETTFDGGFLDCRIGQCAEVHYFEGEQAKLVFRTHHAVMDGNATLFWIKEVFRALRREPLLGSRCDINEWEFAKNIKKPEPEFFTGPWLSALPRAKKKISKESNLQIGVIEQAKERNHLPPCIWKNVVFKKNDSRALAKAISFINKKARSLAEDPLNSKVVIRIPSDMRRLLPLNQEYQLSNMVSALDLEILSGSNEKIIYKNIMSSLQKKQDLAVMANKNLKLVKFLPKRMFHQKPEHFTNIHEEGLADITAIVTHVGRVGLAELSTLDFKALNIYAAPVPLEGVSLSCVFIAHDGGLSLCMSAPRTLVSYEGLKELAHEMEAYMNKEEANHLTGIADVV